MDADGLIEFERHRPRLFALAYRMLGSASEAEDVVQEAYLRWDLSARAEIRSAEAWLTTVLVNLCRTWLDSARARRGTYAGPWLPEPIQTARGELGPLESAEQRELVSTAVLTLLERLTPAERSVFVLREAFGYAHREIADMLDFTEANSQQLYRRATRHVHHDRPRFEPAPSQARAFFEKFLAAAQSGDVAGLEAMFTADIVAIADGGGKIATADGGGEFTTADGGGEFTTADGGGKNTTADGGGECTADRRPIEGATRVARYLVGLFARDLPGLTVTIDEVNAALAFVARVNDTPIAVVSADLTATGISALRLVLNPDKLEFFIRADKATR
ncbi:sigma-70 family RNA polymerase sigma factor [Nocardia jejuensis]|uniref:sigma-70 family RNA polymerase sigma factor n=1 Tax=Nocardia jejuensis TaxID=328049 RepID=UPI0008327851|nr:sigma-70 family RNA polymerase sigma factor [Nocardia jejuensis]